MEDDQYQRVQAPKVHFWSTCYTLKSVTKLEATRTTLGFTVVLFHDREPMALRMVKTWK